MNAQWGLAQRGGSPVQLETPFQLFGSHLNPGVTWNLFDNPETRSVRLRFQHSQLKLAPYDFDLGSSEEDYLKFEEVQNSLYLHKSDRIIIIVTMDPVDFSRLICNMRWYAKENWFPYPVVVSSVRGL